ncbi:MAG TPA: hypothetical protein VIG46_08175 [Candidatus Baltobacteraceae bacterium]|jgi:hypothetical protein
MNLRHVVPCALFLGALVSSTATARADATADLRAFVSKTAPLTFAGYVGLHGAPVAHREGEWTSPAVYGPSLSRCLVVDLPSMASLFGGPSDGPPYSSALQCDGKRNAMTQKQLIAWAIATIGPLATGRTMKQNPPTKRSDRWSVAWKNGRGQTIEFIAYGKGDVKTYPRAGYVVDIEQLSPDAMATPTPAP